MGWQVRLRVRKTSLHYRICILRQVGESGFSWLYQFVCSVYLQYGCYFSLPTSLVSHLLLRQKLIWVGKGIAIAQIRPTRDPFSGTQYFISIVTVLTIALWCVEHQLEPLFGDMGVIAIIPLAVFFGTGILTKEDFNNFLWTVIILAMGGIALGKAVSSSGLLTTIAGEIRLGVAGMGLFSVLVVFAALILVVATFISHTVAALIVMPIVAQVGGEMDDPHPRLLIMGAALMCSGAMGLPMSGYLLLHWLD